MKASFVGSCSKHFWLRLSVGSADGSKRGHLVLIQASQRWPCWEIYCAEALLPVRILCDEFSRRRIDLLEHRFRRGSLPVTSVELQYADNPHEDHSAKHPKPYFDFLSYSMEGHFLHAGIKITWYAQPTRSIKYLGTQPAPSLCEHARTRGSAFAVNRGVQSLRTVYVLVCWTVGLLESAVPLADDSFLQRQMDDEGVVVRQY